MVEEVRAVVCGGEERRVPAIGGGEGLSLSDLFPYNALRAHHTNHVRQNTNKQSHHHISSRKYSQTSNENNTYNDASRIL